MASNLSSAFANSVYAFDRIRKAWNEEADREAKKKLAEASAENLLGITGLDNSAPGKTALPATAQPEAMQPSAALPAAGSDPEAPKIRTTRDLSREFIVKLGRFARTPDEVNSLWDNYVNSLRAKTEAWIEHAASEYDKGNLEGAQKAIEYAYQYIPNNTRLKTIITTSKDGRPVIVAQGFLEDGDHRGLPGEPTDNIVITSGDDLRNFAKVLSKDTMASMSMPGLEKALDIDNKAAEVKYNRAKADLARLQTDVLSKKDKNKQSIFEQQQRIDMRYKQSIAALNEMSTKLKPVDYAMRALELEQQAKMARMSLLKKSARVAGWSTNDVNTLLKQAETVEKNLFKSYATEAAALFGEADALFSAGKLSVTPNVDGGIKDPNKLVMALADFSTQLEEQIKSGEVSGEALDALMQRQAQARRLMQNIRRTIQTTGSAAMYVSSLTAVNPKDSVNGTDLFAISYALSSLDALINNRKEPLRPAHLQEVVKPTVVSYRGRLAPAVQLRSTPNPTSMSNIIIVKRPDGGYEASVNGNKINLPVQVYSLLGSLWKQASSIAGSEWHKYNQVETTPPSRAIGS